MQTIAGIGQFLTLAKELVLVAGTSSGSADFALGRSRHESESSNAGG